MYMDKKFQLVNLYNTGGHEFFCKIEKNPILYILMVVVPRVATRGWYSYAGSANELVVTHEM